MRPHRTDGVSLSFGLLFLLVAVWWAVSQVMTVRLPAAGWLVAGALIFFGTIGLLGAIRSGRRAEVPAPVMAEATVETPGDLPPDLHADIVRELLDDPAVRFSREHPAGSATPPPPEQPSSGVRPEPSSLEVERPAPQADRPDRA